MKKKIDLPKKLAPGTCTDCWRAKAFCVCDGEKALHSELKFLILQYPREVKNPFATARILSLSLEKVVHRIGLSWRSLDHALGEVATIRDWGVLYLGTKASANKKQTAAGVVEGRAIKGIILLDGNWKQSKSLWWRNPWLRKLPQIVVTPTSKSIYGKLRREPRHNSVSTLEAAAYIIEAMEPNSTVPTVLRGKMTKMVDRAISQH